MYTPAPTHPQPHQREPNASPAGHPPTPRASRRPERTETCWFFFSPHLPSQAPKTKRSRGEAAPRALSPSQGKRAQVATGASIPPCAEYDADPGGMGTPPSYEKQTPRFATPSGTEGRAALPPAAAAAPNKPAILGLDLPAPLGYLPYALVFLSFSLGSTRPRSPNPDPGAPGLGPHHRVASANRSPADRRGNKIIPTTPQDQRAGSPARPQSPPREVPAGCRWRGEEAAGSSLCW